MFTELKFAPYSNSKIKTFELCPYKFRLTYIDKVKVSKATHFFEKGSFYHYLLENYPTAPPKAFKFNFANSEQQNEFIETVKKFVQIEEVKNMLTKWSLKREQCAAIMPDWTPSDSRKKSLIYGYIDYLGQERPKEIILSDWKSSDNYAPDPKQLEIYGTWCFAAMPNIDTIKTSFWFVQNQYKDEYVLTREHDYQRMKDDLSCRINRIENETAFARTVNADCKWCPYEHICQPFKNLLKEKRNVKS